jgi:hypothetical protein
VPVDRGRRMFASPFFFVADLFRGKSPFSPRTVEGHPTLAGN